jgi:uncharacterized membrane protein YfcA
LSEVSLPLALFALVVVFLAGVVRGFSGFGFSALCVAALSLFVSPARVVPPVFVLEILASVSLLRGAWPHVDWRWMGWLALGNAIFIPVGVWVLAFVDEVPLRMLIGAMLLAAALALRRETRLALAPTPLVGLASGVLSGFFNGVAAIGGMAVAVLFSAAKMEPHRLRATMIVLLLATDIYALAWAGILPADSHGDGLLGPETFVWAACLLPAMLGGIWVGQRSFAGISPQQFRRHVLNLLAVIALVTVVRAAWSLLA